MQSDHEQCPEKNGRENANSSEDKERQESNYANNDVFVLGAQFDSLVDNNWLWMNDIEVQSQCCGEEKNTDFEERENDLECEYDG